MQLIRDLMQSRVPIQVGALKTRIDEAWRLCCDASKAHSLLGWRPRVTFDEGLRRTIEWMERLTPAAGPEAGAWTDRQRSEEKSLP